MIPAFHTGALTAATSGTSQPAMLIISDDPDFSRAITTRWQAERNLPSFTLVSGNISLAFDPGNFHAAIVGNIRPESLSVVMEAMDATGKRVLFVSSDPVLLSTVRERWPGTVLIKQHDNWLDTLVLVGVEALCRAFAESCLRSAEQAKAILEHHATLGRYMLEMRHNLNNALTSVLGNSELLLLEPGTLSANARGQIETIRNMSLRVHEVLQRFSSLEKELNVSAAVPGSGNSRRALAASVQ
jgi:signal transduction histidine kinase